METATGKDTLFGDVQPDEKTTELLGKMDAVVTLTGEGILGAIPPNERLRQMLAHAMVHGGIKPEYHQAFNHIAVLLSVAEHVRKKLGKRVEDRVLPMAVSKDDLSRKAAEELPRVSGEELREASQGTLDTPTDATKMERMTGDEIALSAVGACVVSTEDRSQSVPAIKAHFMLEEHEFVGITTLTSEHARHFAAHLIQCADMSDSANAKAQGRVN